MRLTTWGGICLALALLAAAPAAAQERSGSGVARHSADAPAMAASPYAGMAKRSVKAISEEQIGDLRAGRGMGLALAAELNGYPGPRHVLDLADALDLSEAQRSKLEELFAAMQAESVPIGAHLIAQETELDSQFAHKMVTFESLLTAMEAIGRSQTALRVSHLKYHLLTRALLTPAQVQHYNEARGYATHPAHEPRLHAND